MAPPNTPVFHNVTDWIENNKQFFQPPVCNKMMHGDGQAKIMFVGGPNQRKDYHIECGEELFYMTKGDMVLKVVERGQHKDIPIKEGELFLLPSRIQHSPQRFADTIGWVIERDRHVDTEKDGLRYFIEKDREKTTDSLFEKWFYCTDIGTQLVPVIKGFFASEQHKTGVPLPGTIPENPPVQLDTERQLESPLVLTDWLRDHQSELDSAGKVQVFDGSKYQFQVYVYGAGDNTDQTDVADTWIWQLEGSSTVDIAGEKRRMTKDDSVLVPAGKSFTVSQQTGSRALVCYQDPTKATTWPK